MSDGGRGRALIGSEGVEVISKVERAAVRRSLHRFVMPGVTNASYRYV